MDSYTDLKIVECNRLHSEEAKSGNNENYSLWQNNLQDILHLDVGDQVSLYAAFISERGAGQPSSIEIKGTSLGLTHNYKYTNLEKPIVTGDRKDYNLPSRCSKMIATENQAELELRDNELKFVMNYFIPASARNCLHLPRRWMYSYLEYPRGNFEEIDSALHQGAMLSQADKSNYSVTNRLWNPNAFYKTLPFAGATITKPKNDNSRYTLLIRDNTYYTINGLGSDQLANNDLRDPENAIYRTYRELKTITIPGGFNSPDFIATEISRQLQNIINDEILIQRNTPEDAYPQPISKLLESETYKAFYSGNIGDNSKDNFLYYFNLHGNSSSAKDREYRSGHTNASGYEWLRQYGIVACKYPEIYETGRKINVDSSSYKGIKGAEILTTIDLSTVTADTGLELDIEYNKINVDLFNDFFNAQKLYPEIIEGLNLEYSGYNPGNTLDNTRWIHINRYSFHKQCLATPTTDKDNTQLGWGGYYYPRSWNASATTQLMSLQLLLYFDPSQEYTFYNNPDFNLNQFSYGCIGKSFTGNILIYPFKHATNGVGSPPIEELRLTPNNTPGILEAGRKIGFDLHFNAPGMFYLLPLSGWTNAPDFKETLSTLISIFNVNSDNTNSTGTAPEYLLGEWKKLLYIGADNPQLKWDGTNFAFSDFHTSKNRGNKMDALKGYIQPTVVAQDDNAEDVVYEINPPDVYNDWTPDRTPYSFDNYSLQPLATVAANKYSAIKTNQNYNPFQIYDQLCGIMIEDFGVPENVWSNSLWGLLGFSYKQFHGTNNRQVRIQRGNANDLSLLTTNAEVVEGDTKIFMTNWAAVPMYNNMINSPVTLKGFNASGTIQETYNKVLPQIIHKTQSIQIIADNLPTRMIRGYYCIRSNILEGTPFIGGKVNNTTMPIIGVVDKINGDGDFYFGQESSLSFTITKRLRLASITVMITDPDGSYARTSEQSTILFKVTKSVQTTFNVAEEFLKENKSNPLLKNI